jgi:hypothetical protein
LKRFEQVTACAYDAGFNGGTTDIDADRQGLSGIGAERVPAHKVCELYPVCAILLSNIMMAAGGAAETAVLLTSP